MIMDIMRKIKIVIVFIVVIIVVLNISLNPERGLSSLSFSNIEALAFETGNDINCMGIGSVDCPKTHTKSRYALD